MSQADNPHTTTVPKAAADSAASPPITKIDRRRVLAVVAAIPVAVALPVAIQHGQSTTDLMRAFIRKLLTERNRLTAGEWIQRKRIARWLQAMIDDKLEPWEPQEVSLIEEMERDRQGTAWEVAL